MPKFSQFKKSRIPLLNIFLTYMNAALILSVTTCWPAKADTKKIVSQSHAIDRQYRSMDGPTDTQHFQLRNTDHPELAWITGASINILDANDNPKPDHHLCHSNLYFTSFNQRHPVMLNNTTTHEKFLDLIQGQTEIQFPENYGIPVFSNESLTFHSMVINSQPVDKPYHIKVETSFEYIPQKDVKGHMRALAQRHIPLRVPVGGFESQDQTIIVPRKDGCEMGSLNKNKNCPPIYKAANAISIESYTTGDNLSLHWLVPPGRHEYRYNLKREGIRIPFNTTVHYMAMHLHPFAESLEFKNITTGETIFKGYAKNLPNGQGLSHLDYFSSTEGIALDISHEYELIAVYNNTSSEDITAMAVMYLYYWDKPFDVQKLGFHKQQ